MGVCVIGPMPPPYHGMSAMNEAVVQALRAEGVPVTVFNTSPTLLNQNGILAKLSRMGRIGTAIWRTGKQVRESGDTIYISPSSGPWLICEAFIAWRARRAHAHVVVHHHSFRYLTSPYWPMRWFVKSAGSGACHVTLCQCMCELLDKLYPRIKHTLVMSNSALLTISSTTIPCNISGLKTIGFLSNISINKGILEVLRLAEALLRSGNNICFKIGGPFIDKNIESLFRMRTKNLPNIEYAGPVYGDDKEQFFNTIDAFIFPTSYHNEAEPLVILEALSHGCPVIAFDRGCIDSMLEEEYGIAIPVDADFATVAMAKIIQWQKNPQTFLAACNSALNRYRQLQSESGTARAAFVDELRGKQ